MIPFVSFIFLKFPDALKNNTYADEGSHTPSSWPKGCEFIEIRDFVVIHSLPQTLLTFTLKPHARLKHPLPDSLELPLTLVELKVWHMNAIKHLPNLSNLTKLSSVQFDGNLQHLPSSLTYLKLKKWDAFLLGTFPPQLTTLIMHDFNEIIWPIDMLPKTLTYLELWKYNQPLTPGVLPMSLRTLELRSFTGTLDTPGILPQGLQILNLPVYQQVLAAHVLPSSLQRLTLWIYRIKSMLPPFLECVQVRTEYEFDPDAVFPCSVKELSLHAIPNILPPLLERLDVFNGSSLFSKKDVWQTFPASLRSLKIHFVDWGTPFIDPAVGYWQHMHNATWVLHFNPNWKQVMPNYEFRYRFA